MNAKVAVIGMGQGGMVAAIKLAKAGCNVTVYEKSPEGQVSYPWRDDITASIFDEVGIPRPDRSVYCQKTKWFFTSPNKKGHLKIAQLAPLTEISVKRRELANYFEELALEAGVQFMYETKIDTLLIDHDRVVGVFTPTGKEFYDLVIDATGIYSPLRKQLPEKYYVQAEPAPTDVFYGTRMFYNRVEGVDTFCPGIDSTLIFKHFGALGISWANLNEDNNVDVLLCQLGRPLTDEEIEARVADLRSFNPILGDIQLSQVTVPLSVRAGIATPMADGYIAIGDSAFMTIPVMGSGIEVGMRGGSLFADYVIHKDISDFTAYNMWPFYYKYMKKWGTVWSLLDVARRVGLRFPAKDVDWLLSSGFITDNDLAWISLKKDDYRRPKFSLWSLVKKPLMLLFKPSITFKILGLAGTAIHAFLVTGKVPKKYSEENIEYWAQKYNNIINKIEEKASKKAAKEALMNK